MSQINFTLDFITSQHGVLEIGTPEGYDSAEFTIGKDNVSDLGRDLVSTGGKITFRLNKNSSAKNHFKACEWILFNYYTIGFNSVIKVKISDFYIGEVDFSPTFNTDGSTFVEFQVIQGGKVQLFKNRQDLNVDIKSLATYRLFYKALPVIKQSKWINPQIGTEIVNDNPAPNPDVFNPIRGTTEDDIQNSLSFYEVHENGDASKFVYIDAKTTLNSIQIDFDLNVLFKYRPQENNSITTGKNAEISVRMRYGNSYDTSQLVTIWQGTRLEGTNNQEYQLPNKLTSTIDNLQPTDKIWIFFRSTQGNGAVTRTAFGDSTITIRAVSTTFSTVFNVVRLFDAMKYVANQISGCIVDAPRWGIGGEFYNQFITTSSLMRGLNDRSFNINQKFIKEGILPEVNGGVQVNKYETIFYGRELDFYRKVEIASFKGLPSEYENKINEKFFINLVELDFENYQSQKENTKENTNDIVHGSAQYELPNPKGQNTKEIKIKLIRDPLMTEDNRGKALTEFSNTATQDDNKVFGIDAIASSGYIIEEGKDFLQHSVEDGKLVLRNQSVFKWDLLGIVPGSPFIIQSGANVTPIQYKVFAVSSNSITLEIQGFSISGNTGINTKFTYYATADLINRTNEDFSIVEGLNSNTRFGNLRFTSSRIVRSYYNEYLATARLNTTEDIKVSKYYNNPNLKTQYSPIGDLKQPIIKEGGSFRPSRPILTQRTISTTINCSFKDWFDLTEKMQSVRGYVRIIDPEGLPKRIFLNTGKFQIQTLAEYSDDVFFGSADITGEEMYEDGLLQILSVGDTILINDEIMPSYWEYSVDQYGKLSIFDAAHELIFTPTRYNDVKVNNKRPSSKTDLMTMLGSIYK